MLKKFDRLASEWNVCGLPLRAANKIPKRPNSKPNKSRRHEIQTLGHTRVKIAIFGWNPEPKTSSFRLHTCL